MRSGPVLCFLLLFSLSANAQLQKKEGVASYYGSRFHGKRTASGEVFDKEKMTAAHRTLPFGTIVKVTRADNGDFVYVRINDRGPFARGRLIDLSRKAAEELGIIHRGRQKVVLQVLGNGVIPDEFLSGQPFREAKINTRLASLTIQGLDLPDDPISILPVLERKPAITSIPVQRLPETFIKKLLKEILPEG